jgi:hypothetical protein
LPARTKETKNDFAAILRGSSGQGCQNFLGTKYQKGKIYQITLKYTK